MGSIEIFSGVTGGEAGPSAKWYHAAFHTVTAVVGVGVLGLPYSFSYLGWTAGIFALIATLAASLYTAYLLSALHEEPDGTRHNRYVDLGRAVLGKAHRGTDAAVSEQSSSKATAIQCAYCLTEMSCLCR